LRKESSVLWTHLKSATKEKEEGTLPPESLRARETRHAALAHGRREECIAKSLDSATAWAVWNVETKSKPGKKYLRGRELEETSSN